MTRKPAQESGSERCELESSRGPASKGPVEPYEPPRLERYGRVSDLTCFGGSQIIDTGGNLGNLQ